jgi:DNA uptake protein ComE-like DNA-binding protein
MKKAFASLGLLAFLVAAPVFAQAPAPTAAKPATPAAAAPAPTAKPGDLIDINTASEQDLDALKGIGKARAAAIIKGRPYKGKDELVQKNIVPQNVYDDIKDKIIARQPK